MYPFPPPEKKVKPSSPGGNWSYTVTDHTVRSKGLDSLSDWVRRSDQSLREAGGADQ